ncbi:MULTISPECIES: TetR/AcrR family transcriptional regulator [Flagellimonas]|uniref:TetR/AcrR family transcriptional regulator n=2 Tax=Flagellimonas TaxID=444459 RepID=A0A3A1NJW5_9FLAO|nr:MULTISPECIES: TetR/AcrR family transcriptional regulator [Allomuricauda]RIV46255.1 TetR/AcrR family transcriptional regulator [Allomuricauda maritima]RIV73290.1 TetR/AcrR family transcriptional regulator [Allomuricauda aequoris]TXJ98954.1 TetR/AcrR family transcriptional regulator [Allomuricauda maritima]TXK07102.1 TetR/AcrR family transcriptional regulator [Allomuricauda aequoris]
MREKIIQKATDMFLNLGFKSITMDDLANEMGISKKTIYSHFKNKTELVQETTMSMSDFITCGIDNIIALEKNPIEELYEIKKFIMVHLKDEKSSPLYQLQKYYPKIHSSLKEIQFECTHRCVAENVKRGMEMGIYRDNLNVEFVSRIYFTGVMSIKDNNVFPTEIFSRAELLDYYLEYHLRGIVTPKGRNILNSIINSNQE